MPSRERVVTTITIESDEERGENVVVSETVEIQPVPKQPMEPAAASNTSSDQIIPAAPATAASPSPLKKKSASKTQARKRMELPSNQRTLGSFFTKGKSNTLSNKKPPPSSKTLGKKSNKTDTKKPTKKSNPAQSPSIQVAKKITSNANVTLSSDVSSSAKLEKRLFASPSFSKPSLENIPATPMADIMAIVLGAHGDSPFKSLPVPNKIIRKVRGVDVNNLLPSMVKPVMRVRSKKASNSNHKKKASAKSDGDKTKVKAQSGSPSSAKADGDKTKEKAQSGSPSSVKSDGDKTKEKAQSGSPSSVKSDGDKSKEKAQSRSPSSVKSDGDKTKEKAQSGSPASAGSKRKEPSLAQGTDPSSSPIASNSDPSVNILRGRKKSQQIVEVNNVEDLSPQSPMNEITSRKKAKRTTSQTDDEKPEAIVIDSQSEGEGQETAVELSTAPVVNQLQPRKKIKIIAPVVNVDMDDDIQLVAVNQLQPRKKKQAAATASKHTTEEKIAEEAANGTKGASGKINSTQKTQHQVVASKKVVPPPNNSVLSEGKPRELSKEDSELFSKYKTMRSKYVNRATELIERAVGRTLSEEDFQKEAVEGLLSIPKAVLSSEGKEVVEFKDEWVGKLSAIVQGR